MAHLLGVASLVMGEAGGAVPITEDMVIAAILHDTVEDHGGKRTLDDVRQNSGPTSRAWSRGSPTRSPRITTKRKVGRSARMPISRACAPNRKTCSVISAADKLYNAKSILDDLKEIGPAVWERFKRGPKEQLWYFHALLEIFEARLKNRTAVKLKRVVDEIADLVATE